MKGRILSFALLLLIGACAAPGGGQESSTSPEEGLEVDDVLGRWDVTVESPDGAYPSWFELTREDGELGGQFVGRFGSARPIPSVQLSEGRLEFSLPSQYEQGQTELRFEGGLVEGKLVGTTNGRDGSSLPWTAVRAPELTAPSEPVWGEPIELFNGQDLAGWKPRHPEFPNQWKADDGILVNVDQGSDLVTEKDFQDFRLQLEFKYPEGSNSGIYLRGRYEVQIQDDFGKEAHPLHIGAVYGFITPSENAARKAGEWQSYDITLLGRRITVALNGQTVIDDREIPGITGGALDSDEGSPGPIMLQGDHGPISFRNIVLTPAQRGQ